MKASALNKRLFKDRYMLAVYDSNTDELMFLENNVRTLAKSMNREPSWVNEAMSRINRGVQANVRYNKHKCEIVLIDTKVSIRSLFSKNNYLEGIDTKRAYESQN